MVIVVIGMLHNMKVKCDLSRWKNYVKWHSKPIKSQEHNRLVMKTVNTCSLRRAIFSKERTKLQCTVLKIWIKLLLNLSKIATVGKEESGRCREVYAPINVKPQGGGGVGRPRGIWNLTTASLSGGGCPGCPGASTLAQPAPRQSYAPMAGKPAPSNHEPPRQAEGTSEQKPSSERRGSWLGEAWAPIHQTHGHPPMLSRKKHTQAKHHPSAEHQPT